MPQVKCEICQEMLADKRSLRRHQKSIHKIDSARRNFADRTRFSGHTQKLRNRGGAIDLDLLHVVHIKQQEIVNIVRLSVQQHSQRVQFSSTIQLKKPPKDEDEFLSSQADCISVYVSSKMERVDYGGLADKNFHGMVKQMLLFLKNFASQDSGWTLDQNENIEIQLVKAKQIKASSYVVLPEKLSGTSALLNIRNTEDENCFLYCYTAACHLKYGLRLGNQQLA